MPTWAKYHGRLVLRLCKSAQFAKFMTFPDFPEEKFVQFAKFMTFQKKKSLPDFP